MTRFITYTNIIDMIISLIWKCLLCDHNNDVIILMTWSYHWWHVQINLYYDINGMITWFFISFMLLGSCSIDFIDMIDYDRNDSCYWLPWLTSVEMIATFNWHDWHPTFCNIFKNPSYLLLKWSSPSPNLTWRGNNNNNNNETLTSQRPECSASGKKLLLLGYM